MEISATPHFTAMMAVIEGYSYANPKFNTLFEQIDSADVTRARDALVEDA